MSFERIVASIEQQLEEDQTTLAEMESQITGMRERVSRLQKARRDLLGESPQGRARRKEPSKTQKIANGWTPSKESVRDILATMEKDGPLTIRELVERTQWSHSHIDSSIRYLRRHEIVRLNGKRGTANLYSPMPNHTGLKETEDVANAV